MKKLLLSLLCLAGLSAAAQTTYQAVASADDIEVGAQYILVANAGGNNGYWAMSVSSNANVTTAAFRKSVKVDVNDGVCDINGVDDVSTFTLVTGTESGSYALQLEDGNYITFTGTSTNNLNENAELTKAGSFLITIDAQHDYTALINNCDKNARALKFNYNSGTNPRYANYSKTYNVGQPQPYLYKLVSGDAPVIARPEFSISGGNVEEGTKVELTCETEGAEIYYTLDGTTPDKTSTLYAEAITINETTTVKAIAYVGDDASAVATATFTVVETMSLEDVLGLANKDTFVMGTELTVVYVPEGDNRYIYVYGDDLYTLIYDSGKAQNLKRGDVIKKGWDGAVTIYGGLFELTTSATLTTTGTEGTLPEYKTVAAADVTPAMVNNIIVIKNVEFAAATNDANNSNNFTGKSGDTELTFRNTFKIDSVEAGTYDVTCVVSVYDKGMTTPGTTLQLLPVEYTLASSGIADIESDNNVAPVYYNLQGVRVANPENGLFIEVRGNKAVKVIK